jgi:hypothetical protein
MNLYKKKKIENMNVSMMLDKLFVLVITIFFLSFYNIFDW